MALAAMSAFPCAPTFADRTDRDKPLNIESDTMTADDAKKTATFEGKVVLTQGSLVIRADRIVVRQDPEGFQQGVATGNPATFRRKQDGAAGYIDGQASKIEYDSKLERVEFFSNARLRRDTGDDIRGDFISYDAKSERFTVKSASETPEGPGEGRVRVIITPKKAESQTPPPSDAAAKK